MRQVSYRYYAERDGAAVYHQSALPLFQCLRDARIRFKVTADTLKAFMKRLHAQCERLDLTPSHRWFVEKHYLHATQPEAANGAAPHH